MIIFPQRQIPIFITYKLTKNPSREYYKVLYCSQEGFSVKITATENGAKIVIFPDELDGLGLSPEDFEQSELSAKIFLSGLVAMLRRMEIIDIPDSIAVKVTRLGDEVIIYLSPENAEEKSEPYVYCAYSFKTPEELTDFCKYTLKAFDRRIECAELYGLGEEYRLIVKFRYAKSTFLSKKELRGETDQIKIAKIREYATLLSRTPLQKLYDL